MIARKHPAKPDNRPIPVAADSQTSAKVLAVDPLEQLEGLKQEANVKHHKYIECWREGLLAARDAGRALESVFQLLQGTSQSWDEWLANNFAASKRTADVYRQIYLKWNDRRVREARDLGLEPTSKSAFLMLVGKPLPPDPNDPFSIAANKTQSRLAEFDFTVAGLLAKHHAECWQRVVDCLREIWKRSNGPDSKIPPCLDDDWDSDWTEFYASNNRVGR